VSRPALGPVLSAGLLLFYWIALPVFLAAIIGFWLVWTTGAVSTRDAAVSSALLILITALSAWRIRLYQRARGGRPVLAGPWAWLRVVAGVTLIVVGLVALSYPAVVLIGLVPPDLAFPLRAVYLQVALGLLLLGFGVFAVLPRKPAPASESETPDSQAPVLEDA
jgi:hypothetical protein